MRQLSLLFSAQFLETKDMVKRRNPFEGLVYYGDWHTPLLRWLDAAEEGTCSPKMLVAIAGMKKLLAENDECIHTVEAVARVPEGMEVEFAADCVRDTRYGEEVLVSLGENRSISLTTTVRGDREYAEHCAQRLLSEGISRAQFALSWRAERRALPSSPDTLSQPVPKSSALP